MPDTDTVFDTWVAEVNARLETIAHEVMAIKRLIAELEAANNGAEE